MEFTRNTGFLRRGLLSRRRDEVSTKNSSARELWPLTTLWVLAAILSILYCVFIYKSLLSDNPQIGSLLPSASDTNLVVSIFSQVLGNMFEVLLMGAFDALRWQLASTYSGVSATTFFQLSSSTQWIPVLFLTLTKLSSDRAEFVYYFRETAGRTPVFAGTGIPLDETFLAIIPPSYLGVFFMSWIPTLLDVPKYAVPMPMAGCEANCSSVFLPGGIETVRKIAPFLNTTLMEGGTFLNSETIQIQNAPGVLLRFDDLTSSFDFDRTRECGTYGQHINDTLQICIKPVNGSLAVGWAACPTILYDASLCTSNTTWLHSSPLTTAVLMTRYKQYATTAYNGLDFTILDVVPTSAPIPEALNASTYLAIFSNLFQEPSLESNPNDVAVIKSVTYGVTWLIRLYVDVFPDDSHSPLSHLRNFLAIPHQFMVSCLQFANYSSPAGLGGMFSLPDDMQTVAVRGRSRTRFLAVGWVVWVYIASAAVMVVAVGAMILGMAIRKQGILASTGFVEIDLAARFQQFREDRSDYGDGLAAMRELGKAKELQAALTSSFGVARELRRRKIRVVSVGNSEVYHPDEPERPRNFAMFAFQEGARGGGRGESGVPSWPNMMIQTNTYETAVESPGIKPNW
ncbi:hypothetical protein MMYC01_203358 [Madurella mycetomatis]|uniref:Uncharacterized protein n=1 Tax=Madurella mycetomatis TaxID=100816 RepID=A0A175W9N4_9PEZI|nr:hypothetical protein MMYC01_203358 [Madurella mycetomatis]